VTFALMRFVSQSSRSVPSSIRFVLYCIVVVKGWVMVTV